MRKEMYLLRGIENEDHAQFTARILKTVNDTANLIKPEGIKVTITQQQPPKISIIPFKKSKIAVISVYRNETSKIQNIKESPGYSGAFIVEEALPIAYEKTWADGEATPGACLLTLFHRKPGINYDTFIDRWHNSHTPLSLKIHPLWDYNRNVVLQKLCDHHAWYDGIVEEHTRTRSELLNPFKFFGHGLEIPGNMISVYRDTSSFLDYKKIETYLAVEYHIVSYNSFQTEIVSQNKNHQANGI